LVTSLKHSASDGRTPETPTPLCPFGGAPDAAAVVRIAFGTMAGMAAKMTLITRIAKLDCCLPICVRKLPQGLSGRRRQLRRRRRLGVGTGIAPRLD